MTKDPQIFLHHILDSIEKIQKYTKNLDLAGFLKNELINDAVVRNIEIIGEAVKNLPPEFKNNHKGIPWKDIAGMRDRITHFYFGLDYRLVWQTVTKDIPTLKKEIVKILKKVKP